MDDFERLLEQTSLGTDGARELIDAVPDRVVERTVAVVRTERAKLDQLIAKRLVTGVRAVQMTAVGVSGRTVGLSPAQFDTELNAALASPSVSTSGVDRGDRSELQDLAARAGSGDRTALDDLLIRVRAVAHRYVRARLWTYPGGADMVDDVAQEVCVAVFGALSRYRDEGRPFEAFVYGIAARKITDAQRAFAAADVSTPDLPDGADDSPTPEEHAVRHSEVQHIMGLLDKLPEKLREILRLRIVAGMSAEETGRALGMTPGAVRVAQHRAINLLRAYDRSEHVESH